MLLALNVLFSRLVGMDLTTVLEQLRRELIHIDAAIVSLERLQAKTNRRGRPPKALAMLRKPHTVPRVTVRRPQARRAPNEEV